MAYPHNIREEELKNLIAKDWFSAYDTTHILGNVDFAVAVPSNPSLFETEYLLWAEAKKGIKSSIEESFVQLIITIGKARTFENNLPPKFLGAFDSEKIAFIQYNHLLELFYQNDFNWNITPSDHNTKEFSLVFEAVKDNLEREVLMFKFDQDGKELEKFIKKNFIIGKSKLSKIRISKNNFVSIYQKWRKEVMPTIDVKWEDAKTMGVIDADFYLADILSEHNVSLREKLFVLLRDTYYELDRKRNDYGAFNSTRAFFTDEQKAHTQFWNRYDRPPKREYWDYIVGRRDLLVPSDVRERKGSFFTPQIWVELSQQYLAKELGENWQDEYYIWDCAAGTGNLLNGLLDKYKIWASTLDKADVDVMQETIKNGANLLPSHVFQFDFLNDSFDNLPSGLREIIHDPEKRKKLLIYINPPYAEAATAKQKTGTGENKANVAKDTLMAAKYSTLLGAAANELYAQFMLRVYREIPGAVLAHFSKIKNLAAPNFQTFRKYFQSQLKKIFLVPADTFDNVTGNFPIGFFIWRYSQETPFVNIRADVYGRKGELIGNKDIYAPIPNQLLMDWLKKLHDKAGKRIAYLRMLGSDIQNNNGVFITNTPSPSDLKQRKTCDITIKNLYGIAVYFAVRHVIEATWLNDRDQYNFPSNEWIDDTDFQNDCLAYTLFSGQLRVNSSGNENHWIPFTEAEVGARDAFKSHVISDYISGKNRPKIEAAFFTEPKDNTKPLCFSTEALEVFNAGRELWKYYHLQEDSNPDASLYDIKMYFQGTKTLKSGKIHMNPDSDDEQYTALMKNLRDSLRELAKCIEPKIYQYGFLK